MKTMNKKDNIWYIVSYNWDFAGSMNNDKYTIYHKTKNKVTVECSYFIFWAVHFSPTDDKKEMKLL